MRILLLLAVLVCPLDAATLSGRVLDARTGEPVARAKIRGGQVEAITGESGAFMLEGLRPGEVELVVTTVGYGLVKKKIQIAGATLELDIILNQEAAVRTDTVNVTADPFDLRDLNAPTEKNLSKSEIQALSMVLVGDPLRAAQSLPGVTSNNDLRSEFSVRGSGYEHVAIYVDGVLTDNFVHSASLSIGGGKSSEKLSLSLINSETVQEMSLFTGAYPSKYGDSTAAVLNLETRDGNTVKPSGRIATGVLSTSAVIDTPFGGGKGSWLVGGRTSYADYLQRFVERITGTQELEDEGTTLNFSDLQSKVVYNLSPRQQVGVSATYGIFTVDENLSPGAQNLERFKEVDSRNLLVNAVWKGSFDDGSLIQARVFGLMSDWENRNRNLDTLDDRDRSQIGFRTDYSRRLPHSNTLEAGTYIRHIRARKITNGFRVGVPPVSLEDYDEGAGEQSFYLQDTWKGERFSLTVGGRAEHAEISGETALSPRAALAFMPAPGWTVRAGAGSYAQFPDFDHVFGFFGNRGLQAERSVHYNLSLQRMLGERTRVTVELYDRQERDQIFSLNEPRLVDGTVVGAAIPFRNALRGYARGVEIVLQRRSANGLTGWISYARSQTTYEDRQNGLRFAGDFDQRHTVNAFGSYRLRPTINVSAQWRYGSGLPIPGFLAGERPSLVLSDRRNSARLPDYSRLDVRVNKAFLFQSWKLTLSGEVLNVLNRENIYAVATDPIRFQTSGRFSVGLEESIKILPALAVVIEF